MNRVVLLFLITGIYQHFYIFYQKIFFPTDPFFRFVVRKILLYLNNNINIPTARPYHKNHSARTPTLRLGLAL